MLFRDVLDMFQRNFVLKALITIVIFVSFSALFAQTNGTWPLTTDGNCIATGFVTGNAIVAGGGVGPVSYGANGAYANDWIGISLAEAITANDYFQYSLTATADLNVTTVAFNAMANHPNGGVEAMYYSVGGGAYVQIGTQVPLLNGTQTLTTISGLNIIILNGQNFNLRIYGWGLSAANKYIYNRDVSVTAYFSNPTDFFRTITTGNWNSNSSWESSPDGINWYYSTLYPTSAANTVYIQADHTITLLQNEACQNLDFTGGSITLGNDNLTIGGTLAGIPYYTYSGTGLPSQTGTVSHVTVTYPTPTSLPDILNTLIIDTGTGNTVTMPNSVTTTNLDFTSGDLALNSYTLTLANDDFALSSADAVISALDVTLTNDVNLWDAYYSIAHTWTTSGTFTDTLDVQLTYPESESASDFMKVWVRDVGDSGPWTSLGVFLTVDNGTTRTITIEDITALNGFSAGNLQWTISETDQTLPVELSTFLAVVTPQNYIMLEWVTQSETNVSGFYLFRSRVNDVNSAERINVFIGATNTSQETSYIFTDREAIPGYTWYYWLQHIELSGEMEFHGPVSIFLSATNDYIPPIPLTTGLNKIYPNPFNPPVNISYDLNKTSAVDIVILNVKGEIIRQLYSGNKDAGSYRLQWNGKDDRGAAVASGIFFVRMKAEKSVSTKKIILTK